MSIQAVPRALNAKAGGEELTVGNVACRVTADCKTDEMCILADLGRTGRGNEELRSSCLDKRSGTPQVRNDHPPEAFVAPETQTSRLVTQVNSDSQKPSALPESPLTE